MIAVPRIAVPLPKPAVCGLAALAASVAAAGLAGADPAPDPAINTTCDYSQVVAAMNDQSPAAAAKFNEEPVAQSFLQRFLASPPPQRQEMLQQARAVPEAAQFVSIVEPVAVTCNNY